MFQSGEGRVFRIETNKITEIAGEVFKLPFRARSPVNRQSVGVLCRRVLASKSNIKHPTCLEMRAAQNKTELSSGNSQLSH